MTSPVQDPAGRTLRPNFGFSVEGLTPREELLFKSLLRLLNHRTLHGWIYTPERSTEQLDLRVVSDKVTSNTDLLPAPSFQAVLKLTAVESKQPGFLTLPVRADELEVELNRLGTLIEAARRLPSCERAALATPTSNADRPAVLGDRPFKLTRWPSPALLGSPERLRIATMLVGKPVTLVELSYKTKQPLPQCIEFVNDLWRANLITDGSASTLRAAHFAQTASQRPTTHLSRAPAPAPIARSLLSRIRSRLGL